MTRTTEIKCDGCAKDITYTGNSVDYRLVLACEGKSAWYEKEGMTGGVMTDMMIYPPIKRSHHFCDLKCLSRWINPEPSK